MPTAVVVSRCLALMICVFPIGHIFYLVLGDNLGPDPGQVVLELLGWYALLMLLWTMILPEVTQVIRLISLRRYRRWFGVMTFIYASLHILAMWLFVLGGDVMLFGEEVIERPYMLVGLASWLVLLPLALTSNNWSARRLRRAWKKLHNLIYPAVLMVLIHYAWQIRNDYIWLLLFAAILIPLMFRRFKKRTKSL